jgi:hypothetical protein
MSIDQVTSNQFHHTDSAPLAITVPRWLQELIKRVREFRQAEREARIAAELPDHLRYDIGAIDHVPSSVSRWQVEGSYQEVLERQWRRGV